MISCPSALSSRTRRCQAGFSLFEMVLTITIMGIIAGVGAPIMVNVGKSLMISQDNNTLANRSYLGIQRIFFEARTARRTGMVITTPGEITFTYADLNDGIDRTVRYYLNGSDLIRAEGDAHNILTRNVSNLQFEYDTPDPNTLSYISIRFTVSQGASQVALRTRTYIRNNLP